MSLRLFISLCSLIYIASSQRTLPKYNVDRAQISVSGASSGACLATQLHVAFSSLFSGVGVLAGVPYYCAQGSYIHAATCTFPDRINVLDLIAETNRYESRGDIDPTSFMRNDKVFTLNGYYDSVVKHETADKVRDYYRYYTNWDNIKLVKIASEHTVPTMDYGNACDYKGKPYLSRCDYSAAYELLNHFSGGNLTRPGPITALRGDFYKYNQKEFLSGFQFSHSMDDIGYIYVPSGCMFNQNRCGLHIALHGCTQGSYSVDDIFARYGGYNEVGELNNIIIVYPQATWTIENPMGCWDWWGYTGRNYAIQRGDQMNAIFRIIQRVS